MVKQITLGDCLGSQSEEKFADFDLTSVQLVLDALANTDAIDLSHAEYLQQQALRGADIITEFLAKIVKTVGYLETKVNSVKNRVCLEYQAPEGTRTTTDMKIWAGNSSPEVEAVQIRLASAKASKMYLEHKFDLMVKSHHHYKEIASGLRRTVLGYAPSEKSAPGWD